MSELKYKVGDLVLIKDLDWYNKNKDKDGNIKFENSTPAFRANMQRYCGQIMVVKSIWSDCYKLETTNGDSRYFHEEAIDRLVQKAQNSHISEEINKYYGVEIAADVIKSNQQELKRLQELGEEENQDLAYRLLLDLLYRRGTTMQFLEECGFNLPEDHQFVDENGNVINATKVRLVKKDCTEHNKIIEWLRNRDMTKYITNMLYAGTLSTTFNVEALIGDLIEMLDGDQKR